MHKQLFFTILLLLILPGLFSDIRAADFQGALSVGHDGGTGMTASVTLNHFAVGFPFAVRVGLGYSFSNPGDALAARKIFINNNQGGTIKKSGLTYRSLLDFLYPLKWKKLPNTYLFFGVRYVRFKANFRYIGNNEDFDVNSNHWGWGIGAQTGFPVSKKIDFVVNTGADYFLGGTLIGHDTSYSPNGESVNPREDYNYQDADRAINQPKLNLRLMLGLSYRFGK